MENQTTQDLNQASPVSPIAEMLPVSNPINPPAGGPKSKLPILIIGIILFLLIAGSAAGFYVFKQQSLKTAIKPTPFPIVQNPNPTPPPVIDPTANWKTYSMKTANIDFHYPSDWILEDLPVTHSGDYSLKISGRNNKINIDWGVDGYNIGCPVDKLEKRLFLNETREFCHTKNSGREFLGLVFKTQQEIYVSLGVTGDPVIEDSEIITLFLSTFKFTQ